MLSIIIVNYRTWTYIQKAVDFLLSSLPSGIEPNQEFEIVVIDNHSSDGQLDSFRDNNLDVRVFLSEGNYGYSHGCNQGALHARGDWLLFMNPDVLADWKTLDKLWQIANTDPKHSIFTGRQLNKAGKPQRSFAPFTSLATLSPLTRAFIRSFLPDRMPSQNKLLRESELVMTVDWVSGSLILIRQADFKKIGGWDEDYWLYCEDEDLCKRAHDIGFLSAQYFGATFIHLHASSTRTTPEVRVLTKSEAIISKHVYIHKHLNGLERLLASAFIELSAYSRLAIWFCLSFLTFGADGPIRERFLIQRRVASYLLKNHRSKYFLSPKSKNYPAVNS